MIIINRKHGNIIIKTISEVGIAFSVYLAIKNILETGYCPGFFSIPACYIVLAAFIAVRLSLSGYRSRLLFRIGSLTGIVLAIYFSYNQIFGQIKCPVIIGIPLCFASFFMFTFILIANKISG